ncbi:TetR family transcriptional regulator [Nocardioides marmoriginsengisoli]|uniref:TetR family transcriptional regulator n=1 Tax=Nocardioides marmoriginsengisoli TaxID=661483 RepID=A0A3N0CHW3_9ACTN|nr:TetR family transcriptional regulator [Nocardioides marmoriginsengisoli]RNL62553.1 TetR family transcriptional regulator [Nocardioides marmoriginsengisoli]
MVVKGTTSRQARRPGAEPGLRERKRSATQQRIAEAAARLATDQGIAETTVDEIATAAGIGRATFFRYFDSKELAIATGLSDAGAYVLAGVLADVPARLGPLDAVRAAYARLGEDFEAYRPMFLEQAQLSRSSPAMLAWTLYLYVDWEVAIAEAVASRFTDLRPGDPRPRMLGAHTMTAARLACDEWVADAGRGDLPALIQQYLAASPTSTPTSPTSPQGES